VNIPASAQFFHELCPFSTAWSVNKERFREYDDLKAKITIINTVAHGRGEEGEGDSRGFSGILISSGSTFCPAQDGLMGAEPEIFYVQPSVPP
jgi:hypothetical protein